MDNTNIHKVNCKVSGGNLPDGYSVQIMVELDYSGVSKAQERAWASRTCIINLQRNLRTLSTKVLNELALKPYKINALQCGKKVESREQKIARYSTMPGMTVETAKLAVDQPEKFQELMSKVRSEVE